MFTDGPLLSGGKSINYQYDIYLVETFKTELASSAAAADILSAAELVFLCCTMRMPPALTEKTRMCVMNEARDTRTSSIIIITCLGMSAFEFGFVFHGDGKFNSNDYGQLLSVTVKRGQS